MIRILHLLILFGISISLLCGQDTLDQKYQDKVSSLDQTLATLYGVISGEKGEKRNWELFRYLFVPQAKLIPTDEAKALQFLTPDDYVVRAGAYLEKMGFFEKEIHRKVDTFGSLVQVFSTYESYHSAADKEPFARGINSIQLLNDGNRWWVVNIYWTPETAENPIPQTYLPKD